MNFQQTFRKNRFGFRKLLFLALCSPLLTSGVISIYKQLPFNNKVKMYFQHNEKNNYIIKNLAPLDDYRPTFYLPTCLAQMAYNEIKAKIEIDFRREYLETEDGGLISLDWATRKDDKHENRLIVILHGLTGGSESSYIREIVDELLKDKENKVVVVQYRGINDSPLLTPKSFHCGDTSDITVALDFFRKNYPHLPVFTVGTSMGANIMVKLFSHNHKYDDYVHGFVSISNPFNIVALEERNRGTILDYFLKARQQSYVKRHYEVLKTLTRNWLIN